ncbi:MAG: hypothetical protein JNK30_18390 [Phenylobacterium sp.]|uniref:hypothetical protein n=1 Tax=Phenylobacterium sp. TaxID=1871053 RepID=UPI001A647321|nr:hypothetical protein [Phenylobacterium sp.]MBL8773359.1 hypothetical protein [Phenylobacterium sp.]
MQKAEAEKAIRHLCHEWRKVEGLSQVDPGQLSVFAFMSWLREHHPSVLNFRSIMGVHETVDLWFDQEFGQTWRR